MRPARAETRAMPWEIGPEGVKSAWRKAVRHVRFRQPALIGRLTLRSRGTLAGNRLGIHPAGPGRAATCAERAGPRARRSASGSGYRVVWIRWTAQRRPPVRTADPRTGR